MVGRLDDSNAGMYMCEVTTTSFWSTAALGDMIVIGASSISKIYLVVPKDKDRMNP